METDPKSRQLLLSQNNLWKNKWKAKKVQVGQQVKKCGFWHHPLQKNKTKQIII